LTPDAMMLAMGSRTILTLGARNLGGAVLDHFAAQGWNAAAVARSEDTLAAVRERGALAIEADAADPEALERAMAATRERFGSLDVIVNAVTASRPREGEPWGGGPIAEGTLEGFRGWTVAVAEQSFAFLSAGARALLAGGSGGTLIQVTGGSARRAMPGRGPWAAGAFATRALTLAAAQELRGSGVHVALLIVDATIESPKTAARTRETPREALADMSRIAEAVRFLAEQDPRAYTHELAVTPAGETWVP
jgi:NAD(P)-dependent dehydrogenase (short-subunit alcohol dehydrogenase family)